MKRLLLIPYVLTISFAIVGSAILPIYLWELIGDPYPYVHTMLLPTIIILTPMLPILTTILYIKIWEWIWEQKYNRHENNLF